MLILPTLIKAVGTGIGFLGSMGSADRYEAAAELNYGADRANASASLRASLAGLRLDRIGLGIERGAASTNLRLAMGEVDSQRRNAQRLRRFAETRTESSRKAIRRQIRVFDEFQGAQRAAIGASGVTESGSALEVMAETAAQFRLQIADMHDEANFERNQTREEAGIMEIEAGRSATRARAEHGVARRGFALSATANKLGRLSALTAYQAAIQQAEIRRLSGQDAAQGTRVSAFGSLLSGVGGYLSDRYTANEYKMR